MTIKFRRLDLSEGSRGWEYVDGEHTFVVKPTYAPDCPNYRGYNVFHTGERPDIAHIRKQLGKPPTDVETQINSRPIGKLASVRIQIELLMKAIKDAEHA